MVNSKIQAAEENLIHVYNRFPIALDHGEGMYLYDTEGKEYIDADKYRELSAEEAEKYWTINNGDLFGKGLLEDFEKESEFLKKQYTGKILSFSDNQRGSLPHWRIGGA